jgi:hypothetical protein
MHVFLLNTIEPSSEHLYVPAKHYSPGGRGGGANECQDKDSLSTSASGLFGGRMSS